PGSPPGSLANWPCNKPAAARTHLHPTSGLLGAAGNRKLRPIRAARLRSRSEAPIPDAGGMSMLDQKADPQPALLAVFNPNRTRRLATVGRGVLRYGLVALMALWGAFKFTAFEAEGIRPLVEHSPLLHWLYPLLGVRGTASLIGVVELAAAGLICTRRWRPALSAVGS